MNLKNTLINLRLFARWSYRKYDVSSVLLKMNKKKIITTIALCHRSVDSRAQFTVHVNQLRTIHCAQFIMAQFTANDSLLDDC
jgi:hypothetical protein